MIAIREKHLLKRPACFSTSLSFHYLPAVIYFIAFFAHTSRMLNENNSSVMMFLIHRIFNKWIHVANIGDSFKIYVKLNGRDEKKTFSPEHYEHKHFQVSTYWCKSFIFEFVIDCFWLRVQSIHFRLLAFDYTFHWCSFQINFELRYFHMDAV